MKTGHVFPDLLAPLGSTTSVEERLERTLRRLVALTGAAGGGLVFRLPRARPVVVTVASRRLPSSMKASLPSLLQQPVRAPRLDAVPIAGRRSPSALVLLRTPLGAPKRPLGELALVGPRRRLGRRTLPSGFAGELGTAIEQVWRLHQRTLRVTVLNEIMRLLVSGDSLDEVFRGFAEGVARLVVFDSLGVSLVDAERGELEVIDVLARATPRAPRRDTRLALAGTLVAELLAKGEPMRVDDLTAADVPETARAVLTAVGYRSAMLVPLVARGGTIGAVTFASLHRHAFDPSDVEIVAELARPLASAIEQRRLLEERRRQADELKALYDTSRLITSLDRASVLDRISRSVTTLIGGAGCGIGLINEARTEIFHAAAHGFKTEEGRALSMPIGEGLMGACAASGAAILVDDVRRDPRSARRDIDERESIRSMLCVPLEVAGTLIGVISAFATRPAAFTLHHQHVLEAFAEQAGIAIHNAQLFEDSVQRARETRALLEAGRAVTASLDVAETMRVIMEQARAVLGVASCGIMTVDPTTRELVSVASLDLAPEVLGTIRVREGEGITGQAVRRLRPVQSHDLTGDDRVRYREIQRTTGFRSILAAPLRKGDAAIGAIIVFRQDVHRFSEGEEELLLALADQAAIALEHARLYEQLEGMVADRTRQLDEQRRFVEVVLETLPLGVFVLDADLAVVRDNRESGQVLPGDAVGRRFVELLPTEKAPAVDSFLREAFCARRVRRTDEELAIAGETRIVRLTAAPLDPSEGDATHIIVLAEDVTLAKRLERQMLMTERLTTAGRLASGVAHELNNPLATIAGCAESLLARLREGRLAGLDELSDFQHYLALIEEEAYRCKDITGSLLQFVREPGSRRAPTDLNGLVQKTIELLSHQARFAESRFVTELDPALPEVTVNPGQLRQVFLGLASNALEAMGDQGTLTIRTRARREEVEVELEDEGPGIPAEILPRIFDAFFTTKPPGQGTGLGLAIAQSIVADHGGRIEPTSTPGKGSVFHVVLPR